MANDITSRLADLLKVLELSQNQFAMRLGVSQPNFNRIMNGKRAFGKNLQRRVVAEFGVSPAWLSTGELPMFDTDKEPNEAELSSSAMGLVPVYSLKAIAGFSDGEPQEEYIEGMSPWADSHSGDFAVHVNGNSMSPQIPDGALLLVRPYNYFDFRDLEFGRVHVVVTNDDRVMIKVVKLDPESPRHILLISFNPDFPPRSIPIASIRRVFLAVAVQAPL